MRGQSRKLAMLIYRMRLLRRWVSFSCCFLCLYLVLRFYLLRNRELGFQKRISSKLYLRFRVKKIVFSRSGRRKRSGSRDLLISVIMQFWKRRMRWQMFSFVSSRLWMQIWCFFWVCIIRVCIFCYVQYGRVDCGVEEIR